MGRGEAEVVEVWLDEIVQVGAALALVGLCWNKWGADVHTAHQVLDACDVGLPWNGALCHWRACLCLFRDFEGVH